MTPTERALLLATARATLANFTHSATNYQTYADLRDALSATTVSAIHADTWMDIRRLSGDMSAMEPPAITAMLTAVGTSDASVVVGAPTLAGTPGYGP